MMSETAYFVKDVAGPKGSVSIVSEKNTLHSDNIDSHTKTNKLRIHHSTLDENGQFRYPDESLNMAEEPEHQELCEKEQRFFLNTIKNNMDLTKHIDDAINSLKIVLAADRSVREGCSIGLANQ
jgi:predicted dehydrogenase